MSRLITLTCIIVLLGSTAFAQTNDEKIANLEKAIQELQKANAELVKKIDGLSTAVPPAAPAAPAAAAPTGIASYTSVGGDIRWRGEMYDNVWDYSDENASINDSYEYNRFRNRIWLDSKPLDDLRGYIRLTNEYKWGDVDYESFSNADTKVNDTKDIAIDNAFIEISNIWDRPLTLKVGRQDIIFGEGFSFLDGTPYDGSETIGFDAIRLTYAMERTTIDLIQAKTDEGASKALADDEDVSGLYVKGNWIDNDNFTMTFEPYFLYRNRNNTDIYATPWGVSDTNPELWTGMPGLRLSGKIQENLTYAAEIAYQFGELEAGSDDVDRDAWGGYLKGTYTFAEVGWTPAVTAAFTYLSGDEEDSEDFEGWDTFYAEWPKFSELYIYSVWDPMPQAPGVDPDLGAWTNMYMPEFSLKVNPTEKLAVTFRYLYYWAVEHEYAADSFDRGDGRGHNPQLLVNYQFNKFLSGHILGEYFDPGDFYDEDDAGYFARVELMLKF